MSHYLTFILFTMSNKDSNYEVPNVSKKVIVALYHKIWKHIKGQMTVQGDINAAIYRWCPFLHC